MRVRTITIGVELTAKDLIEVDGIYPIDEKLKKAKAALTSINSSLVAADYVVQTQRVSFNSFEEWLLDCSLTVASIVPVASFPQNTSNNFY